MGLLTERGRRRAPLLMLIAGLGLIGLQAYMTAGSGAIQYAIGYSLQKLVIQIPAGIVAIFVASRLIENDFGPISGIAMRIAAISIFAEGVACWIPVAIYSFVPGVTFGSLSPIPFLTIMAELTVYLIGFFLLFELGKWETWLVVLLNFAALFGAHYLVDNYLNQQSFGSRPAYRRRR
jgi:hypothetical protein